MLFRSNGNGRWDTTDLWAQLGDEGELPVTGDWDGDGKDDIGIFGPAWFGFDPVTQTEIVERLLDEEDAAALIAWLRQRTDIDAETAEKIAGARLPDGHSRLGRTALSRLVPELRRAVITYDKAVVAAELG